MERPDDLIKIRGSGIRFAAEVNRRSGTDLNACFHCRCCAGGCPFFEAMDYAPHGVIRLVQLGLKQEALECSTIWLCVGCHTCSLMCPMAVDMAAIMDALRQIAIEKGICAEPDILNFHKEVLNSVEHYGRTHKLEIMLRYKIYKRDWLSDMNLGIKMLLKRKLDLTPSRVKDIGEVKKLFAPEKKGESL